MIYVEQQPLRNLCGQCLTNMSGNLVCPAENQYAIFPNTDTTISFVRSGPADPSGNEPGKKQFEELGQVECGEIRRCLGCYPVVSPSIDPFCKTEATSVWFVKPRQLTGDDCKLSIAE
jgi:hypothetical protein